MTTGNYAFSPMYQNYSAAGGQAGGLVPSTTVAATTSAVASTVFSGASGSTRNTQYQIEICNTSASWAYVNFGTLLGSQSVPAAVVATGYPVGPGADKVVTVPPECNAASVILASGTGNVIFTRGQGV